MLQAPARVSAIIAEMTNQRAHLLMGFETLSQRLLSSVRISADG